MPEWTPLIKKEAPPKRKVVEAGGWKLFEAVLNIILVILGIILAVLGGIAKLLGVKSE